MTDCDAYRTQDWVARAGRPLCADPLGIILSTRQADRLAEDLSGRYEPFAVEFVGQHTGAVRLDGTIYEGETAENLKPAGYIVRSFRRDLETSEICAHHEHLALYHWARRRGFSSALWKEIRPYYCKSGVGRIELYASLDDGGFVWARAGYVWDPTESRLTESLANVRTVAEQMASHHAITPADRALLEAVIESLHPSVDDLPSPLQLAMLSTSDSPNLGRTLMRQAHWYGVLYL